MPARWPGARADRRLLAAIAGSVALHAAGGSYFVVRMLHAAGLPAGGGPSILQGRVLTVPEAPVAIAPLAGEAAPSAAATPSPSAGLPAVVAAAPAAAASAPQTSVAGALEGFRPADQLTTRPQALSTGELEPGWLLEQIADPIAVTASVYVAPDGSVVHVEIRQSSDPRASQVVRNAFLEARFKPGLLQGREVAARVDVSLYYEARRDRGTDPLLVRPPENVLAPSDMRRGQGTPDRQRDAAPSQK